MNEPLNESRLRKELIQIYEGFLKNPRNKRVISLAQKYTLKYSGLQTCNEHLVNPVISKSTEEAISGLSTIYQYGLWEDTHEAFSNDKIIKTAKKILKELKKLSD